MHGRGDIGLTTLTYSLNITKIRCVSLLDSVVFVTRSVLGLTNAVGETKGVRGGDGKEGDKGGGKSTDAGLERPCYCIVYQ